MKRQVQLSYNVLEQMLRSEELFISQQQGVPYVFVLCLKLKDVQNKET